MVKMASLDFVQRNDDCLEEDHMLLSEGDSEARNYTGQDIQQLRSAIKLEVLVDKAVEAVGDSLADHFPPGHQLGIQPVQNVFQILPFPWLF
jgi:hypothetical protein